jgi:preprotein translocase subunit SecD
MATRNSRPGRTIAVLLGVIAVMFAAVASLHQWKPRLGLDLQGGTRITLQAKTETGGGVTSDKLNEAVGIISSRVNGAGVAEAEVTTQGSDIIVVEIPGADNQNLERTIGSTAQLRFRLVAYAQAAPVPQRPSQSAATTPTTTPNSSGTTPTSGGPSRSPSPTSSQSSTGPAATAPTAQPGQPSSSKNRAAAAWLTGKRSPKSPTKATPRPSAASATPSTPTAVTPAPTAVTPAPAPTSAPAAPESGPPTALQPANLENIPDPLNWQPSPEWQAKFAAFHCPKNGAISNTLDLPSQPLLSCDEQGTKYLLGPAMIEGTQLNGAKAELPTTSTSWVVSLDFNGDATKTFAAITTAIANKTSPLTGQQEQFAIVLDKKVISAPVVNSPITTGQAIIQGSSANPFTQESASSLANSLKYGALPLSFSTAQVTTEGPELASNQLRAGVIAGIFGLLLVVAYCLVYYRGLGLVVIASLVIAGLLTYASVLLLGHAYGFTLTLPGIAGLIVAVGITADSFIVYFERLRDEVRDGKTLRTSVETGWIRARTTILAADAVSLLAAMVLFIFAIGVVKGFAFALGLTTFIDIFVVFFFTKPTVTLLSRTAFFGQGHKWSGLDRQHLGMPARRRASTAEGGA